MLYVELAVLLPMVALALDIITVVLAGNVTLPVPSAVPIVMMVFELAAPAVPMLTFLVLPAGVTPAPILNVALAVVVPMSALAPAAVMLPLALNKPVINRPVVANTATFAVPPMLTVTLPPELTTVTFDVPLLILDDVVDTPVNNAPLPNIKVPAILPVVLTLLPVTLAMAI